MGLFSSGSDDTDYASEAIGELVENAESDTVTEERLTQLDTSGILSRGLKLNDSPLIDYLTENEQPGFILFDEDWIYCITDKSFVVIINNGSDDRKFRIPLKAIKSFYTKTGGLGHKVAITIDNSDVVEEISQYFDFDQSNPDESREVELRISNYFDSDIIYDLDDYLSNRIEIQRNFRGNEDIIEEGYISYYSYDNDEYYKGKSGHIGLTGTAVKLATKYNSYEIGAEDIVEVNNHQSTRIKTYTERGSLDFEKDLETETGLEIVSKSGGIFLYSVRQRSEYSSIPKSVSNYMKERFDFPNTEGTWWKYTLIKPFDNSGTLKIEGWTDGNSMMQANIDADAETKGKSRGVEVGPFTRSKTRSKSSIGGEISGEISDNTYSSEIICFRVYEERLLIDSDIKLDLHYSELDSIYQQKDGVVIEVGSTTFRIDGVSVSDQIGEAVAFIKEQMDTFAEEETTPDDEEGPVDSADKLRELKKLHEDGILTDDEFESKKEDLLDDF